MDDVSTEPRKQRRMKFQPQLLFVCMFDMCVCFCLKYSQLTAVNIQSRTSKPTVQHRCCCVYVQSRRYRRYRNAVVQRGGVLIRVYFSCCVFLEVDHFCLGLVPVLLPAPLTKHQYFQPFAHSNTHRKTEGSFNTYACIHARPVDKKPQIGNMVFYLLLIVCRVRDRIAILFTN